jgi:hypothetical protein
MPNQHTSGSPAAPPVVGQSVELAADRERRIEMRSRPHQKSASVLQLIQSCECRLACPLHSRQGKTLLGVSG